MNELETILNKYFGKDKKAVVFYNIEQEEFDKVVNNAKDFERPDIVSMYDNKVIGIEHFEFDSFNNTRKKGSEFKIKDDEIRRNFNNELVKLKNMDSIELHDKIENTVSLENYYRNFETIFKNHYDNINEYENHLKQEFNCTNKEIHICFFAEDVSPIGSYYESNKGRVEQLLPINSKKIIELLENSPKVEYLIIGSFQMTEYRMYIIKNSRETYEKFFQNNEIVEKEESYINFVPEVDSFAIKIEKSY